jgi:hypothetical protein
VFADRLLVNDITKFENIRNVVSAKIFGSKMQASYHKQNTALADHHAFECDDCSAVDVSTTKHNNYNILDATTCRLRRQSNL